MAQKNPGPTQYRPTATQQVNNAMQQASAAGANSKAANQQQQVNKINAAMNQPTAQQKQNATTTQEALGSSYKVGANGQAPQNLNVGDTVKTNSGSNTVVGINANGTYTPESGKAWNEVIVSVPALESVSGTFTLVSDTGTPIITHNLGTYDVFVVVYVDADNYTALQNGGYTGGTHSPVKVVAVIGNLNKDCQVKNFGVSRLAATNNTVGISTCSINTAYTSINEVAFSMPNATWWRAGITYKYTVVKYGQNTTEMGA